MNRSAIAGCGSQHVPLQLYHCTQVVRCTVQVSDYAAFLVRGHSPNYRWHHFNRNYLCHAPHIAMMSTAALISILYYIVFELWKCVNALAILGLLEAIFNSYFFQTHRQSQRQTYRHYFTPAVHMYALRLTRRHCMLHMTYIQYNTFILYVLYSETSQLRTR